MATLIKSANGLLFHDDFSVKTLMWTLSPSDKSSVLEFGDKGLRIKHSDTYVTYTIVEPEADEYCLITKLDHQLVDYNDIAGVIVLSSNKQYTECQTYLADEPSPIGNTYYTLELLNLIAASDLDPSNITLENVDDPGLVVTPDVPEEWTDSIYPWIKMYKILGTYSFYASTNGYDWIEVGNVRYENNGQIGLFQYAAKDISRIIDKDLIENSHCYFEYFDLYSSKYITIYGIDRENYDFEIVDDDGHILVRTDDPDLSYFVNWKKTSCIINTTTFPMPSNVTMKLYKKNQYGVNAKFYNMGTLYGGDVFTYEHNIKLFVENIEVNPDTIYDLGEFYSGNYYIRLEVHNFDEDIAYNKTIKVIRYSEYYNGEEEVYLADGDTLQLGQMPYELNYHKEITLDEIQPSGGRNLYMRLMDKPVQDFFMTANDFRFKIIIE